jgi:hypothetical protein
MGIRQTVQWVPLLLRVWSLSQASQRLAQWVLLLSPSRLPLQASRHRAQLVPLVLPDLFRVYLLLEQLDQLLRQTIPPRMAIKLPVA